MPEQLFGNPDSTPICAQILDTPIVFSNGKELTMIPAFFVTSFGGDAI
jgi:hypothetical protein